MSGDDPWAGLLNEGEEILWQGRPSGALRLEWRSPMDALMPLAFVAFSVFWMVTAATEGGLAWMFGLIFFGVGVHKLIGEHLWKAYVRRNTHYTLTTQSIFIATAVRGKRKLERHPISPDTEIDFEEGHLSNIWLHTNPHRVHRRNFRKRVGFEQIENGRDVFAKLRQAQEALS
jgi:hypothetical protein